MTKQPAPKRVARTAVAAGAAITAAKRKSRLERRRTDARREILDSAIAVLRRDGVVGLTLDQVARELGVTKQGLYYHYSGKEELLVAIALEEWLAAAHEVNRATLAAPDGPAALEALLRSYVGRYRAQLEMFRLVTQGVTLTDAARHVQPEDLAALRPINDLMYGAVETKLSEEQRAGLVPKSVHPRRLAFVAHTAAMGMLTMKLLAESVNDPLLHSDDALLDELCRAFRAAARGSAVRSLATRR